MTSAISEDRRHHSRITFHTPVHLTLDGTPIEAELLDISLKGALVKVPNTGHGLETSTSQACQLTVSLDETTHDQIRMETRITHVHGARIGLLCLSIDLDSITHLRRLVELNLGEPNLLERELSALIAE